MSESLFKDIKPPESQQRQPEQQSSVRTQHLEIGQGRNSIRGDARALWAGGDSPDDAPWSVDTKGNTNIRASATSSTTGINMFDENGYKSIFIGIINE